MFSLHVQFPHLHRFHSFHLCPILKGAGQLADITSKTCGYADESVEKIRIETMNHLYESLWDFAHLVLD